MDGSMTDIELIRDAGAMLERYGVPANDLRALADRMESQSKAEPNLHPKDMGQARRFISQLEGEVERLKAENEELRRLNKEANKIITMTNSMHICSPDAATYIDDQNKHIAHLEAHLSAIRQAVEKAIQHVTVVIGDYASATMYEQHWLAILDAINPAPVVNQQLTTADTEPAHSDHPLRHWDRSCLACNPDAPVKEKIK